MSLNTPGVAAPRPVKTMPRWQRWLSGSAGVVVLIISAVRLATWFTNAYTLPSCDSQRAKDTLSDVFKEKDFHPTGYRDIQTVSSAKDLVSCEANLPVDDKTMLDVVYKFTWSGSTAQIEYTIYKKPL